MKFQFTGKVKNRLDPTQPIRYTDADCCFRTRGDSDKGEDIKRVGLPTPSLLFTVVIALCCAVRFGHAAESAVVGAPGAQTSSASSSGSDVTMAAEYRATRNVIQGEKPVFWSWYLDVGYESQYNFRGTNLTPDADGAIFIDAAVSKWDFTLGVFGIHQFGTARANSFSISETGGGHSGFTSVGQFSPETIQTRLNELDLFLTYRREFGPIELTVGDIGFFINRDAQTFLNTSLFGRFGPFPTVGDEQFDRIFVRLATNVIPHVQPWITYYQTIYNDGQDHHFYKAFHIPFNGPNDFVRYGSRTNNNFHERNDRFGGYLEGRLRGNFPISRWVDFNPYGVISCSFHDRSEPVPGSANFRDIIRGRSLSGFNVAQVGLELPIHLFHFVGSSSGPYAPPDARVNLIPFSTYSYHISTPPAGTDRNEVFGGVKFALAF